MLESHKVLALNISPNDCLFSSGLYDRSVRQTPDRRLRITYELTENQVRKPWNCLVQLTSRGLRTYQLESSLSASTGSLSMLPRS